MAKSVWTKEQEEYLRENYGKLTYRKMTEYLPYGIETIRRRAKTIGIVELRGAKEPGAVPMEKALNPKECKKMWNILRGVAYYHRTQGVSVWSVIQAFRDAQGGQIRRIDNESIGNCS